MGPVPLHRKALLEALAEELPNEAIRFSSKLISIEQQDSSDILIQLGDGTLIKTKLLVGCDGVHSVVAKWLGLSQPVHSGRSAVRGLAVFPEGHGLGQDQVHQFIDAGKRAGYAPLNDTDMSSDPNHIQKTVMENCKDFPAKYLEIVRQSDLATLSWAPLVFRYPWNVMLGNLCKGGVTVAGDAMHPMTPDLAHGGASALEDSVVLGRHIGESFLKNKGIVPQEVGVALKGYVKERRWRAAVLITGSYISGWAQLAHEHSWWKKFLMNIIYVSVFPKIYGSIHYDCGKLPCASPGNMHDPNKLD
ncbi:FAD-binding domain [Dillenia turbinata]|uniref:FAD-binding domain n=1 Tax=Dillenia turbinata TaxID=194707 RepID=A0AAN8V3E5_9MAGN